MALRNKLNWQNVSSVTLNWCFFEQEIFVCGRYWTG